MDVAEAIETKLEVREYADEPVDEEVKRAVLDAGRLAPSGKNDQHWRFVLVEDDETLGELAAASHTGGWIAGADFAVVVTTDSERPWHEIDAGRAVTHMQFAAWAEGVVSCIYTGLDDDATRELLDVPEAADVTLVAGFGYPTREIRGRKDREPLEAVASRGRYGEPFRSTD